MEIRPYKIEDREACLSVFDSLGEPTRRPEFAAFLERFQTYRGLPLADAHGSVPSRDGDGADHPYHENALDLEKAPAVYLVLEHDGRLIGCGGFRAEAGQPVARLEWGMIQRDLQRQGLGRYLLLYRLKEIGRVAGVQHVELTAPPGIAPFFEKYAFRVAGEDSGLVCMRMKLQVCA